MADVCSPLLCDTWSEEILRKLTFQKHLKNTNVTTAFKKDNPLLAKNYRPVSALPTVSKYLKE